ncbi:hypothetical protein [Parafrankia discariae]|uniref:hypothetical protein n=1 Tax=Parafrankia discariae TaxID=365528 RepID=UPI00035FAE50|nr:hypothetical protein [Parafrankia discariae]
MTAQAAPCPGCGQPIIPTWSAATGWGLILNQHPTPTITTAHTAGRRTVYTTHPEQIGYILDRSGAAHVACAPGPHGNAGAGEARDQHTSCGRSGQPEAVTRLDSDRLVVHPCGQVAADRLGLVLPDPDTFTAAEALRRLTVAGFYLHTRD